jgi:hypothetical protein
MIANTHARGINRRLTIEITADLCARFRSKVAGDCVGLQLRRTLKGIACRS